MTTLRDTVKYITRYGPSRGVSSTSAENTISRFPYGLNKPVVENTARYSKWHMLTESGDDSFDYVFVATGPRLDASKRETDTWLIDIPLDNPQDHDTNVVEIATGDAIDRYRIDRPSAHRDSTSFVAPPSSPVEFVVCILGEDVDADAYDAMKMALVRYLPKLRGMDQVVRFVTRDDQFVHYDVVVALYNRTTDVDYFIGSFNYDLIEKRRDKNRNVPFFSMTTTYNRINAGLSPATRGRISANVPHMVEYCGDLVITVKRDGDVIDMRDSKNEEFFRYLVETYLRMCKPGTRIRDDVNSNSVEAIPALLMEGVEKRLKLDVSVYAPSDTNSDRPPENWEPNICIGVAWTGKPTHLKVFLGSFAESIARRMSERSGVPTHVSMLPFKPTSSVYDFVLYLTDDRTVRNDGIEGVGRAIRNSNRSGEKYHIPWFVLRYKLGDHDYPFTPIPPSTWSSGTLANNLVGVFGVYAGPGGINMDGDATQDRHNLDVARKIGEAVDTIKIARMSHSAVFTVSVFSREHKLLSHIDTMYRPLIEAMVAEVSAVALSKEQPTVRFVPFPPREGDRCDLALFSYRTAGAPMDIQGFLPAMGRAMRNLPEKARVLPWFSVGYGDAPAIPNGLIHTSREFVSRVTSFDRRMSGYAGAMYIPVTPEHGFARLPAKDTARMSLAWSYLAWLVEKKPDVHEGKSTTVYRSGTPALRSADTLGDLISTELRNSATRAAAAASSAAAAAAAASLSDAASDDDDDDVSTSSSDAAAEAVARDHPSSSEHIPRPLPNVPEDDSAYTICIERFTLSDPRVLRLLSAFTYPFSAECGRSMSRAVKVVESNYKGRIDLSLYFIPVASNDDVTPVDHLTRALAYMYDACRARNTAVPWCCIFMSPPRVGLDEASIRSLDANVFPGYVGYFGTFYLRTDQTLCAGSASFAVGTLVVDIRERMTGERPQWDTLVGAPPRPTPPMVYRSEDAW